MSTFKLAPAPLACRALSYFNDVENSVINIETPWITRETKKHYHEELSRALEAYNNIEGLPLPSAGFIHAKLQALPDMIEEPIFVCMYLAPEGEQQHYDLDLIPGGGRFCERCSGPSTYCLLPMPWQNRLKLPTDTARLDRQDYFILCLDCINRRCTKVIGCSDFSKSDPEEQTFYEFYLLNLMPYRKIFGWPVFQSLLAHHKRIGLRFDWQLATALPKCYGFFTVRQTQTKKAQ